MQIIKEMGATLKFAFKTANKKVYLIAGSIGVLTGLVMGGTALMGNAINVDLAGSKIAHSKCVVTDKHVKTYYDGRISSISGYEVDTSCGLFDATSTVYDTLGKGQSYNLAVTAGNWANKPTVVSAEETN